MPTNNTLSDIKYKLFLRCINEWRITDFAVAEDNPAGCTAQEIADFKTFRAAWKTIMDGDMEDYTIDVSAEMLVGNLTIPDYPTGWRIMQRSTGDLPPMLMRISDLDQYDASYD